MGGRRRSSCQCLFFLLVHVPKKGEEKRLDSRNWYAVVMGQLTEDCVFLRDDLAANKVDKFLEADGCVAWIRM